MKKIIVYESGTGFTANYAAWIAEELSCEAKELKKVSDKELKQYDTVIFGGWIMGNTIVGLEKIRALNPASLTVYAVGATPPIAEIIHTIKEQNHIGELPFFYFQGGINYEKMGFFKRMILKTLWKSVVKKENKTEQDLAMEQTLAASCDYSDREQIRELVDKVKG